MKRIRLSHAVQADVRAIDQPATMRILTGPHRYAETGQGDVKTLEGDLAGLLRFRIGDYRVLFDGTGGAIHVHRVRNRKQGLSLRGARIRLRQVLRLLPVCHRVFITVQWLKWPWEVE